MFFFFNSAMLMDNYCKSEQENVPSSHCQDRAEEKICTQADVTLRRLINNSISLSSPVSP